MPKVYDIHIRIATQEAEYPEVSVEDIDRQIRDCLESDEYGVEVQSVTIDELSI